MLSESLVALASAGGASLVQAAGTDAWAGIRDRVARLMARGSREREDEQRQRLDRTATALADSPGEEAGNDQAAAWQAYFEALLTRLEGAELNAAIAELRALADNGTARPPDASAPFAGSVFHGPTAIQTGNGNRQDNHFGHGE